MASTPSGGRYQVEVSDFAAEKAAEWGWSRSGSGKPSEPDFWSGPIKSAALQLRDFESCPRITGFPDNLREVWVVDPVFGAVVFTAVLVDVRVVIADFSVDDHYWSVVNDDPT